MEVTSVTSHIVSQHFTNALPTELKEISTNTVSRRWLWTYYSSYNLSLRSLPITQQSNDYALIYYMNVTAGKMSFPDTTIQFDKHVDNLKDCCK
jgi:hypothetical protein